MITNQKYNLLSECLEALKKKTINLLIEKGEPGMAKTYSTINYLKDNKVNFEYINTYTTPLSFYQLLYKHRNKDIIVFDDISSISDVLIRSILKSACSELPDGKRTINYHSTSPILEKEGLPDHFDIKARIILIFNENMLGFESIINRGVLITFNFSFKEKIEIFKDLNLDKEIIDYVEKFCNEATKNLSIRTIQMLSKLKSDGFDFKIVAKEVLETNETLLDLISMTQKEWCDKSGSHKATYYRLKKKNKV